MSERSSSELRPAPTDDEDNGDEDNDDEDNDDFSEDPRSLTSSGTTLTLNSLLRHLESNKHATRQAITTSNNVRPRLDSLTVMTTKQTSVTQFCEKM